MTVLSEMLLTVIHFIPLCSNTSDVMSADSFFVVVVSTGYNRLS